MPYHLLQGLMVSVPGFRTRTAYAPGSFHGGDGGGRVRLTVCLEKCGSLDALQRHGSVSLVKGKLLPLFNLTLTCMLHA
jgi:hypothetical protein